MMKTFQPKAHGAGLQRRCLLASGRPCRTIQVSAEPSTSTATTTAVFDVEAVDTSKPAAAAKFSCNSGELLRTAMMQNKVDLYTTWGKVWQCGGVGQCGTCIVEVLEGSELLSERTNTENKKLNKKPSSYRLACQTVVGDGTNGGQLKVKVKP